MGIINHNEVFKYKYQGGNRQLKRPSDEYYTLYEEVEYIFTHVIDNDQLKDKIIYCPADSEESEFVKYLKDKKDDIQYKELIYTCDDFREHEDLFKKSDFIITNPPFSLIQSHLIPILNKYNKKFFLFGSLTRIPRYYISLNDKNTGYYRRPNKWMFRTDRKENFSTGNEFTMVNNCIYFSNMVIMNEFNEIEKNNGKRNFSKKRKEKEEIYVESNGIKYRNYDRIEDIPLDFKDEFICPCTCLLYRYKDIIEIIDPHFSRFIGSKKNFSDGKGRYLRVLCKLK